MAEAEALVEVLAPYGPRRILSSPLARCVQTVDSLAKALDVAIEPTRALALNANATAAALVRRLGSADGPPVVLCTHREVIERLQARLGKRSGTSFGKRSTRAKASTWILDWVDGELRSAIYLPPPTLDDRSLTSGNGKKTSRDKGKKPSGDRTPTTADRGKGR
jgi:broad specificity phosphatase PhoE